MKNDTKQWCKDDRCFFKYFGYIIAFGILAAIIGAISSADAYDQASVIDDFDANTQTVMGFDPSVERTEYLLFVQSILDDSAISRYEVGKEYYMFRDTVEVNEGEALKRTKAALLTKVSDTLE